MRRPLAIAFTLATAAACSPLVLGAADLTGTLDSKPVNDSTFRPVRLSPAAPGKVGLPVALAQDAAGARLFAGELDLERKDRAVLRLVLVEPATGEEGDPQLWADADLDGRLGEGERFTFPPADAEQREIRFELPWPGSRYRLPVAVRDMQNVRGLSAAPDQRMLLVSASPVLAGTVEIAGTARRVQVGLDAAGGFDPKRGSIGIDTDGNGTIEHGTWAGELEPAGGTGRIFRVGDTYVSVRALDPAAGTIKLRTHPASDYRRIEVALGKELPDFAYTDFTGKRRRLSELRGKYVLLDVWATWCAPCIADLPHLEAAYATYRDRGFEILGIDYQDDLEKAKELVAKERLGWLQATAESTADVVARLGISSVPQTILLDPQGKVVGAGLLTGADVRPATLAATLEKLLPK